MDVMGGLTKSLSGIQKLGIGIISVVIVLLIAVIVMGITNDDVIPELGLENDTVANATAVVDTGFSFIESINNGLGIVGALVLLAIVIAIFSYMGFLKAKKLKGNNY